MTQDRGASPLASRGDVVVVGGGLAGISAAIELADAGADVTLLEARPWLGGATCSFGRRGLTIDNGQHAFLRSCTAYRDLLARLGTARHAAVQDRLDVTVLDASGDGAVTTARVCRSSLPAPLHLAGALARYRPLTRGQRLRAGAAALTLRLASGDGGPDRSMGAWLADRGQDEQAPRALWDLLCATALNAGPPDADLPLAASAVTRALLGGRDHADIAVPRVPLSALHGEPAAALLARLGARVQSGVRVAAIRPGASGGYQVWLDQGAQSLTGRVATDGLFPASGEVISAAGVVLAVPVWEAAALAPAQLGLGPAGWAQLRPAPVVSIHVIYAGRVTGLPFAAVAGAPVRWVADKTASSGLRTGQYLAATVPAAGRYVDTPATALRAEFLPLLARLFPAAAATRVEDFFVTRERQATFAPAPGSGRVRPGPGSGLPGLALAGAWTDTGWPDTMEGAVRSGRAAARRLLADLRLPRRGPGGRPAAGRTARAELAVPALAGRGR